jgi:hypothetical protein
MFGGVVPSGERLATQRLGASSKRRIVDAILSGTHERGTSHYELLRAFVDDEILGRIDQELNARDYRIHEFGDSVFLERAANRTRRSAQPSVAAGSLPAPVDISCLAQSQLLVPVSLLLTGTNQAGHSNPRMMSNDNVAPTTRSNMSVSKIYRSVRLVQPRRNAVLRAFAWSLGHIPVFPLKLARDLRVTQPALHVRRRTSNLRFDLQGHAI